MIASNNRVLSSLMTKSLLISTVSSTAAIAGDISLGCYSLILAFTSVIVFCTKLPHENRFSAISLIVTSVILYDDIEKQGSKYFSLSLNSFDSSRILI